MDKFKIIKLLNNSFKDKTLDLRSLFDLKLYELNMSENQAHKLLDIDKNSLNPILDGTVKYPNMFNIIKICDFLELPLDKVISTLLSNQTPSKISKLKKVQEASFLTKHFDLEKLRRANFISTKTDTDKIKERVLSFFGFDTIYEFEQYDEELDGILFSKTKRKFVDKMRNMAVKSAYRIFQMINNPNPYDREELKELIPKMKPYCQDVENGLLIVCQALYNLGVTVCLQHHLTTSQYRGATFIVNGKPCIVLTDLNKNFANIWYALLHELYHVLFDFEQISKQTYHITGQPDVFLVNEDFPDEFAREYFFGKDMYNFIKPHIDNEYLVKRFAKENNIHHCFVYRGFQIFSDILEGNKDYWKTFHWCFPDVDIAIENLSPLSWRKDEIPTKAKILKDIFELNKVE